MGCWKEEPWRTYTRGKLIFSGADTILLYGWMLLCADVFMEQWFDVPQGTGDIFMEQWLMCPKALEQYSWSSGLMCPKAPGYYIQQYAWSNGLMCPKAPGYSSGDGIDGIHGPKASVQETCSDDDMHVGSGDFQRKIPSGDWSERCCAAPRLYDDTLLAADYLNS